MKARTPKEKIFVTRFDGKPIAYTRHHRASSAQALVMDGRIETTEASIDDLMHIGKEGIEVGGFEPDIDPAQQQLPIA